jgi:hypothetical protein
LFEINGVLLLRKYNQSNPTIEGTMFVGLKS